MDLSWTRPPSPLVVQRGSSFRSMPAEISRYEWAKRVIDVSVAVVIVVLFLPLWALIALIIKLTSRGPVLFQNLVIGQHGKPFIYYKFRTMFHNCSDAEHRRFLRRFVMKGAACREAETENREDPGNPNGALPPGADGRGVYKLIHDPRVTPFGRFLRKSSLDEIPQMINVLRGEMSLVGPRPPLWYEYEMYGDWEKQRLAVKPGITGLYQVTARDRVPFAEMVRIDLDYIRRRSLSLDLWIILKTVAVMAQGE